MFQTHVVEKIKSKFIFSNLFFENLVFLGQYRKIL